MRGSAILAMSLFLLSGCASQRPVLYPNEQFNRRGAETANREIDECMRRADDSMASNGRAGTELSGAAVTQGLLHGLTGRQEPSAVYKNFVFRCLREKGYSPVRWD